MSRKKRKSVKKRGKKRYALRSRLFYISILLIAIFLGFGYYKFSHENGKKPTTEGITKVEKQKSTKELMDKMKKILTEQNSTFVKHSTSKIAKKSVTIQRKKQNLYEINSTKKLNLKVIKVKTNNLKKEYLSEIQDFKKNHKSSANRSKNLKKRGVYRGKPKLAIIIDDVSFLSQVRAIKKIPYKVTPSFFPPSKLHPDTAKLSRKFRFAMVHLPLEAVGYMDKEPQTIMANSSRDTIEKRVKELQVEFPHIRYYNNHTGSKFTANLRAMKYLLGYMKTQNLHFVDSRTTINTKAGIVCDNLHIKLLSRDIFLDNITRPSEIIKQLKKAVKIAKKSGYAIAIGHPHKNTLQTLLRAKRYLDGVELVYVDEL